MIVIYIALAVQAVVNFLVLLHCLALGKRIRKVEESRKRHREAIELTVQWAREIETVLEKVTDKVPRIRGKR